MTRFAVLVVCPAGTTVDDHHLRITELLAPYDHEREVTWNEPEDDADEGYWSNPDGRFDGWKVGGDWSGAFPVVDGLSAADRRQVLRGGPAGRADGGPKRCLDLDGLRDERGSAAVERWDSYAAAVAGTAPLRPWSELAARVTAAEQAATLALGSGWAGLVRASGIDVCAELGLDHDDDGRPTTRDRSTTERYDRVMTERRPALVARWQAVCDYSWEDATTEFWDQERVRRLADHPDFRSVWLDPQTIDALDASTRDGWERDARRSAVSAFAVVMPDGQWSAPGRVDWFGTSDVGAEDRRTFDSRVSDYLDALPGETFLVLVECLV